MHDRYDEHIGIGVAAIWFWAIGGALVLATVLVVALLRPMFLGFERKAAVQSHQYIEAYRESATRKMSEYHELEVELAKYKRQGGARDVIEGIEMQKRALKIEIRTTLAKLPKDEHPEGSEMFR